VKRQKWVVGVCHNETSADLLLRRQHDEPRTMTVARSNTARKKRRRYSMLVVGIALAILLVMGCKPAQDVPARMSDDFVETIGVNTHLHFLDSAYDDRYPMVRAKLSDLGVRHARNGAILTSSSRLNDLFYGRLRNLAALGIRFNMSVDPRRENQETINEAKIARIERMADSALESFEGPNEYNKSGDPNWSENLTSYQKDLYRAVKNNPSTRDVPVLSPAIAKPYPEPLPDLSAYSDYANMHSYPGGRNPGTSTLENYSLPAARAVGGNKPLISTETGYHTALNYTGHHSWVSERAMGKYTPRLFFEYFNRGIERTYLYEFIDSYPNPQRDKRDLHFGLLRKDGTEKPAYVALENLIDLLEDQGPNFETGSLEYSLSGNTAGVHRTLLQKRDGRFYLVLWQEVSSYDLKAERDISVPDRKVTLTLDQSISRAAIYRPNRSITPLKQYSSPRRLTLEVPDELLVIELSPSTSGGFASNRFSERLKRFGDFLSEEGLPLTSVVLSMSETFTEIKGR
jgi:hypothetical protein